MMKKIIIAIICLIHLTLLKGQDTFVKLSKEEEKAVYILLDKFMQFSSLTKDDTVDLKLKKEYLWLFEDRAMVINDFNESNNKLSIQEYSNVLSMKIVDVTDKISYYPYMPKVLKESVMYDKLDDIYLVPVQLKKVLNYSVDTSNTLIKKRKEINLRLTVNIYKNENIRTISNITVDPSTKIIWKDCVGKVDGKAIIFSKCKEDDFLAINYQYKTNCECIGTPIDCKGVPNGPVIIGSECDDVDKNTINDVYLEDCNCKGTCTVVGEQCEDGDKNTVNDVYLKDCTCKGEIVDCNGKPNGKALPATKCDDNDPETGDDVWDKDCKCKGKPLDCEGTPGGLAVFGSKCDDGNENTSNDFYQEDCTCIGFDCVGVLGGPAIPGTKCGEDDTTRSPAGEKIVSKVYQPDCSCKGLPLDCDGIPNGSAMPGNSCDDGDKTTINDVIKVDCNCKGEPKPEKVDSKQSIAGLNYMASVGALGLYSIQNTESNYRNNFLGAGVKLILAPKRNKKLRFHIGVAYLPFRSTFSYNDDIISQKIGTDRYGEETYQIDIGDVPYPEDINIILNDVNGSIKYTTLQIPLGISYSILNFNKTEILVELSAKPHLNLGTSTYELNAGSVKYEAKYTDKGKTTYIADTSNEDLALYFTNTPSLKKNKLNNIAKANSPFAIGLGIQFLQQLGTKNNSYFGLHIHNNFFLQKPGWMNESKNPNFSEYLVDKFFNKENEMNKVISVDYDIDIKPIFFEFGASYIKKL